MHPTCPAQYFATYAYQQPPFLNNSEITPYEADFSDDPQPSEPWVYPDEIYAPLTPSCQTHTIEADTETTAFTSPSKKRTREVDSENQHAPAKKLKTDSENQSKAISINDYLIQKRIPLFQNLTTEQEEKILKNLKITVQKIYRKSVV